MNRLQLPLLALFKVLRSCVEVYRMGVAIDLSVLSKKKNSSGLWQFIAIGGFPMTRYKDHAQVYIADLDSTVWCCIFSFLPSFIQHLSALLWQIVQW